MSDEPADSAALSDDDPPLDANGKMIIRHSRDLDRACLASFGWLGDPVDKTAATVAAIVAAIRPPIGEPVVTAQLAKGTVSLPYADAAAMLQVQEEARRSCPTDFSLKRLRLIDGTIYFVPAWSPTPLEAAPQQ